MNFEKIILASGSPRRRQLLQWAEIPFEINFRETDERYPDQLTPPEIAMHIAFNKAHAVKENTETDQSNGNGYPILAADTIVVYGNRIIGKPPARLEAIETLTLLSGRTHSVITGVCIL